MVIFITLIISIYFFSRLVVKEMFFFLMRVFRNRSLVISLLTLVLLPGTFIHELAHFLVALVLLLPVRSMSLFPSVNGQEVKLGEVKFDRRDPIRGILVGIAPLFFGVLFIFGVFYFKIYPSQNIWMNVLISYILFSVSSNMFSSPQDLKETVLAIPFALLIAAGFYLLDIKVNLSILDAIMKEANYYLLFVLVINISLFFLMRLLNSLKT